MSSWIFDLSGSHLALDFANTVSNRGRDDVVDRLASYADLVAFARQTTLVSADEEKRLLREARSRPLEAGAALAHARALREALYGLFAATALGDKPTAGDLYILNAQISGIRLSERMDLEWASDADALDAFVGRIVIEALELLLHGPRDRVRVCEADTCSWVFLDKSKNRSRRWCDMTQCGNRAKAQRFHERKRQHGH